MPQPLSSLHPDVAFDIAYDGAAILNLPDHITAAMAIVSFSASFEYWVGSIIIELAPQRAVQLARHQNSLEADGKKSASVDAILSVLLPEDKQDLYKLLSAKIKRASKLRNPFAHCRFGFLNKKPDVLVVIDPRHELLGRAKRIELDRRLEKDTEEHSLANGEIDEEEQRNFKYYTLNELLGIVRIINETNRDLMDFWNINRSPGLDADAYRRVLSRLEQSLHGPD